MPTCTISGFKMLGVYDTFYNMLRNKVRCHSIGHADRNGGAFHAEWDGKEVAVMLFDVNQPMIRFLRDVKMKNKLTRYYKIHRVLSNSCPKGLLGFWLN